MDKKILKRLLIISSVGLLVAGIIFLYISMLGKVESNWSLCAALVCILLSNLFNLIRVLGYKNRDEEDKKL